MKIRPFLSHKRENSKDVGLLKDSLKLHGAGGWKDTDDLRLGASTEEEIHQVIFEETGGFVWWGTHKALESKVINGLEIPTALERVSADLRYPLVPVFVSIAPNEAGKKLARRIGKEDTKKFLNYNGVLRGRGESIDLLRVRVASRYVRDATASLPQGEVSVAFRALSEPSGEHDLTFDWRAVLDARARLLEDGSLSVLLDALANVREAFQARERSPEVSLDSDLPLPLAFLVGYEWRGTTRLRLRIGQRTGATFSWIEHDGPLGEKPVMESLQLSGNGPAVLAVSCGDLLKSATMNYAIGIRASELVFLHAPGMLDSDGLRALARAAAHQLRRLNDQAVDKHLLIRGPGALAMICGAEANATGHTTLPFWNGSEYVSPIVIGG